MATRGFPGETTTPMTGGGSSKYGVKSRKRAGKKVRSAPKAGGRGHLQSASFNAPGQAKKRAGLTSARTLAPGHTKANIGSRGRTPTAPTSTPPHPRKGNSMTGSSAGGTVGTNAIKAGTLSRIKGNAAPASGRPQLPGRGGSGSAGSAGKFAGMARRRRAS